MSDRPDAHLASSAAKDTQPPAGANDPQASAAKAAASLRHGLIATAILVVLVVALLLAIPGLHGVAHAIARMPVTWLGLGIALEMLSCLAYVLAFWQVF